MTYSASLMTHSASLITHSASLMTHGASLISDNDTQGHKAPLVLNLQIKSSEP